MTFKVASGDWSTVNMGAGAQGADVALDTAKTLATSDTTT